MRCAIDFDEEKALADQTVRAWGEMQKLSDEPAYSEEDIKSEKNKMFFYGYKCAMDDVCNILANFEMEEPITLDNISQLLLNGITERVSLDIQEWMAGDLCCQLFSILDDEYSEEHNESE